MKPEKKDSVIVAVSVAAFIVGVGERSEELYDLISINPVWKTFTIVRVGADRDNFGRHMGWVTYDYNNNVILSQG